LKITSFYVDWVFISGIYMKIKFVFLLFVIQFGIPLLAMEETKGTQCKEDTGLVQMPYEIILNILIFLNDDDPRKHLKELANVRMISKQFCNYVDGKALAVILVYKWGKQNAIKTLKFGKDRNNVFFDNAKEKIKDFYQKEINKSYKTEPLNFIWHLDDFQIDILSGDDSSPITSINHYKINNVHPVVLAVFGCNFTWLNQCLSQTNHHDDETLAKITKIFRLKSDEVPLIFSLLKKVDFKNVEEILKNLNPIFKTNDDLGIFMASAQLNWSELFDHAQEIGVNLSNSKGEYDETPLHIACRLGHKEIIKKIAEINILLFNQENRFHQTPIIILLQNNQKLVEELKILINAGVPERLYYPSPMRLLTNMQFSICGIYLCTNLLNLMATDRIQDGCFLHTLVTHALVGFIFPIYFNYFKNVYLKKKVDDTRSWNEETLTPTITILVFKNNLKSLKQYIENFNPDINVQDINGNTALHHAVKQGNYEICKYLLEKKINVDILNKEGMKAYDLAKIFAHIVDGRTSKPFLRFIAIEELLKKYSSQD
jgi:ankyrin repeat protein